jgi:hypothetical protein
VGINVAVIIILQWVAGKSIIIQRVGKGIGSRRNNKKNCHGELVSAPHMLSVHQGRFTQSRSTPSKLLVL